MDDPRQKLDAMAPAVERVRTLLPPLPPVVYVVTTPILGEADKRLCQEDGVNIWQPAFASKADAEAKLAHVEREFMTFDREEVFDEDKEDSEFNEDGTYTFSGVVLEMVVE